MDFSKELEQKASYVQNLIYSYLPQVEGLQKRLAEAMNYSMMAGGKRLRPMMLMESFRLFSDWTGEQELYVGPFMAAIEMIHTHSLIHDDLPAIDNDEYRRKKLTTWKAYGEAMGVLSGDALLNFAYEVMLLSMKDQASMDTLKKQVEVMAYMAQKTGIDGMLGGQCVDVELEKSAKILSDVEILFIHERKTAALLQASLVGGAILGGADKGQIETLERIAYLIGIAFQIQDDILDVVGQEELLGKPVGSDQENGKQTYVTIHGLEASRAAVESFTMEAMELLERLPGDKDFLRALFSYLIRREM